MDDVRDLVALSVPAGSRVLAVAPAPELLARLADRDCRTWSVVADDSPALAVRAASEAVAVADLDALDAAAAFPGLEVDAVVLAGVLAAVPYPAELLRRLAKVLAAEGSVVASVPNATHAPRRLRFWQGDGQDEEVAPGRPLLRAFTAERIEQLLGDTGLRVVDRLPMRGPASAVDGDRAGAAATLPRAVIDFLAGGEDADVDHWVVVASPAAGPAVAHPSLAEELRRRAHEAEDAAAAARADVATMEGELAALQLDLAMKDDFALDLRARLQVAEGAAAQAGADLDEARTQLADALDELRDRRRELDDLRAMPRTSLTALLLDRFRRPGR